MKRIDENHSFNINVCQALQGHIQKAIILKEIYGWCHINQTKGHNLKKGLYWSFMSARAFHEKFPYMNKKSISRWLKELEAEGFIFSDKFNKVGFDKTKWYTINFEQYDNMVLTKVVSKSQFEKWIDQIEECYTQNEVTIPPPTTPTTQTPNFKKNIKKEKDPKTYSIQEALLVVEAKMEKRMQEQRENDLKYILEYFFKTSGKVLKDEDIKSIIKDLHKKSKNEIINELVIKHQSNILKAEKEKKEKVSPKRKKLQFDWPDIFLKTPELKTAFEDFIQMRKEIKKPYKSQKAIETKLKALEKDVKRFGLENVIGAIVAATGSEYQGIFVQSYANNNKNKTNVKTTNNQHGDLLTNHLKYLNEDRKQNENGYNGTRWNE